LNGRAHERRLGPTSHRGGRAGQSFERGKTGQTEAERVGEALGGGQTYTHAGEGSGADRHGKAVQVGRPQTGLLEEPVDPKKKVARVGATFKERNGGQDLTRAGQRHAS